MTSTVTVYGIRHHGPGCARSLLGALNKQQPDVILLEAPQEFDELFVDAPLAEMKPPVAALFYQTDAPKNARFYPFATFSPEWQAINWARDNNCALNSMDLPACHAFGLDAQISEAEAEADSANSDADDKTAEQKSDELSPVADPFEYFARADGYTDGERWWNDKVEERGESASFFEAILEAVTVLRTELDKPESDRTLLREAWMRQKIKLAQEAGYKNVAVVCGAWHAPVLSKRYDAADAKLLKKLPKTKVSSTWTPWNYQRLSISSGYGAGILSPGWYDHLWSTKKHSFTRWMTRAARILRRQDYEASSASIIEASRLSHSLAGLRGRPRPGLDESLEAIQTVFCGGASAPLALLQKPLIIGEKLGTLPDTVANLPLQKDIELLQKQLRLKPEDGTRDLTLDLREESARKRSCFLHRLGILNINYAKQAKARTLGTFKERWLLTWSPSSVLDIVDASVFGNTLEVAAEACLLNEINTASLSDIADRLNQALLAELTGVVPKLVQALEMCAVSTSDTLELVETIPSLVQILRYGDVRKTDTSALSHIVQQLTERIHAGLPSACVGIANDVGSSLSRSIRQYSVSLNYYQNKEANDGFYACLNSVSRNALASAEPKGCATRLLQDAGKLEPEKTRELFSFATSAGNDPSDVAYWLQGFLMGSGSVLVHDMKLLAIIDDWLGQLSDDAFMQILPMLRRTFGEFEAPVRSQLGSVIQSDQIKLTDKPRTKAADVGIDSARAHPALLTVTQLLGLPSPEQPNDA